MCKGVLRAGRVDGMDVLAVKNATAFAKEFALKNGPIVLEMVRARSVRQLACWKWRSPDVQRARRAHGVLAQPEAWLGQVVVLWLSNRQPPESVDVVCRGTS